MKQQLKQRRTVYGQSFFNSPPYPAGQNQLMGQAGPEGGLCEQVPAIEKTRNA